MANDGEAQGELQLRSPWLTGGYADDDVASATLWQGGWLNTQDVASIGADRRIVIRDRLKDLIKTGGEWVSSIAIEEALLEHDSVAQAAVISIPDERWGERPVAYVVARDGRQVDPLALTGMLRDAAALGSISRYAVTEAIHVLDTLPLTGVGKIDKVALRVLHQAV
jgi:fatty-acyl-CoA synthase